MTVFLSFLFVFVDSKKVGAVFRYSTMVSGLYFLSLLIYSRNRSGPAAMVICFTFYYLLNLKNRRKFNLRLIPDFFIVTAIALFIVAICNPNIMKYYYYQWLSTPGISNVANKMNKKVKDVDLKVFIEDRGKVIRKSDMIRVNLAKKSISQIKSHPFGRSFKDDTHVFFVVDIIFAAGIIGIIWIFVFTFYLIHYLYVLFRRNDQWIEKRALVTSLFAWLLVGLMYNSSHMGIAWGFLGITICLREKCTCVRTSQSSAIKSGKVILGRL
jgi:hypothetical protein